MSHPDPLYDPEDIPDFEDGALDIPVEKVEDTPAYKLGFAEGKVAGLTEALRMWREGK